MKKVRRRLPVILFAICLLVMILDAETAKAGVRNGIQLSIQVIIPSLFPLFIVTSYLNTALLGFSIPGMHLLGKLLHIPRGGESILLLGLIGGYPVGAQLIGSLYHSGKLDKRTAQILLGYCNNAGPSFLFGVTASVFQDSRIPAMIWLLEIFSAILTGLLLPYPYQATLVDTVAAEPSSVQALNKSISAIVSVCGWAIACKVIIAYLEKWFLATQKPYVSVLITGILELSNGCVVLSALPNEAYRLIYCCVMLAFGGICVLLQTKSAVGNLGLGLYIPGKIIQTCICVILSVPLSLLVISGGRISRFSAICTMGIGILVLLVAKGCLKNKYGNLENLHV